MNFNFSENKPVQKNIIEEPPLSKEQIIAKKFVGFISNGKFPDLELTHGNIENIKKAILSLGVRLAPGDFNINQVIDELKKTGVINLVLQNKQIKNKEEEVIYKTDFEIKLKGLTPAEISEEQLRIIEANLLYEEAHRKGIFKNADELNKTHEKALALVENKNLETLEDYLEFVKAGLIKPEKTLSPQEVTTRDFNSIGEKKEIFAENAPKDPILYKKYIEAKKIATIVERSLAYCCTEGGWYSERFRIVLTSLFDDIKRGVDEVCLIEKDNEKHDVLGLGVDATYRGLKSDLFKNKFTTLLESIKDGHKTKIKYFKDHNGKMMREFTIPKIILHFDIDDVKEFVNILNTIGDDTDGEKIKNSYLKAKVMNQVINSCKILASFAKESKNSIFRDYYNVLNSIEELSWENEELKSLISISDTDPVSEHMNELIEEFKKKGKNN